MPLSSPRRRIFLTEKHQEFRSRMVSPNQMKVLTTSATGKPSEPPRFTRACLGYNPGNSITTAPIWYG